MFRGPYFILSAMHAGTTTIFKVIEAIETHTSSNIPFRMKELDIGLHRNRATAPGADCITYRMISRCDQCSGSCKSQVCWEKGRDSMLTLPSHNILTPGQPVMFLGPSFILRTMQGGTTPIIKVFGVTGPSTPTGNRTHKTSWSVLGHAYRCLLQGLLRIYSSPGGSIRSPHPRSPQGLDKEKRTTNKTQ